MVMPLGSGGSASKISLDVIGLRGSGESARGLPARDPAGVPLAPVPSCRRRFILPPAPSDISPAVASPSLVDPAPRADGPPGRGVALRLPVTELVGPSFFFFLFRVDSVPLESEPSGDPGRFRDLPFFTASAAAFLPWGVSGPLDDELTPFLSLSVLLSSSSFSDSEPDSLCAH